MPLISLNDIVVAYESLFEAYINCKYKNACSKTTTPIEVMSLDTENGKFLLIDGHHRLVEYLATKKFAKNDNKIQAKINDDSWAQNTFAVPPKNLRWEFDGTKKFGNLERFTKDLSGLRQLSKKLSIGKKQENITEAITDSDREKIENAKSTDILTVYHGVAKFRLPLLINGFDTTADHTRDYREGSHRGLFITADFELSKRFGGGAVLELKVPAKMIHGTDWSGKIGREEEKEKGEDAVSWAKKMFPNSFRPYMSHTMLASGEPQGLLIGIVKPSQISKLWIRNLKTGNWDEWTRDEYLNSRDYYNSKYVLDKTEYQHFHDAGINLADPKIKLEDFVKALAKFEEREGFEQTYIDYYIRMANRDVDRLDDYLNDVEIGGSKLGRKASENIKKQILTLVDLNKVKKENVEKHRLSLKDIEEKYKDYLDKFSVFERKDHINVSLVVVKKEYRGQGIGRDIFNDIIEYSNLVGKSITLSPDSKFGTSKAKLSKFYKSLGFVLNKGKNKDFSISDLMYRNPKTTVKENTMYNKTRFQKLAGIIKESVQDMPEADEVKLLVKMWLEQGGKQKVADHVRKNIQNFFKSARDKEDLVYGPDREQVADSSEVLDAFLEEIVETAEGELRSKVLDMDLTANTLKSMAEMLDKVIDEVFDEEVEEAKMDMSDEELATDPYSYYGVKRSDF